VKNFQLTDRNGNHYFCNDGVITLKRKLASDAEIVGEINFSGHLLIGRDQPIAQVSDRGIEVDKVAFGAIEIDKFVVMNTPRGCFARVKKEIVEDENVRWSMSFSFQEILVVPWEGLKPASITPSKDKTEQEIGDRSVLPNKVPMEQGEPESGLKPTLDTEIGLLRIPVTVDAKYRWWSGGQSLKDTLLELGATREVAEKYLPEFLVNKYWPETNEGW